MHYFCSFTFLKFLKKPGIFSFMTPLDEYVWVGVIMGYLTVSVGMYLVTRVSPSEWTLDSDGHYNNDFHFQNSLWFNLGNNLY